MIEVDLLHYSPLINVIKAARTCYSSFEKSDSRSDSEIGPNDSRLLERLIKLGHHSVFEHLYYTFFIKNLSRLALIELTRHRIASYSVKSTRWTLKKDKKLIDNFKMPSSLKDKVNYDVLENYFQMIETLINLENVDSVKYLLPEGYTCELVMTINARSLFNFFTLRLSERAHFEMRELAVKIYRSLPKIHREKVFDVYFKQNGLKADFEMEVF